MDFKCRTGRFSRSLVLPSSVVLSRGISGEITQTEEILLSTGKKTTGSFNTFSFKVLIHKMEENFRKFKIFKMNKRRVLYKEYPVLHFFQKKTPGG